MSNFKRHFWRMNDERAAEKALKRKKGKKTIEGSNIYFQSVDEIFFFRFSGKRKIKDEKILFIF